MFLIGSRIRSRNQQRSSQGMEGTATNPPNKAISRITKATVTIKTGNNLQLVLLLQDKLLSSTIISNSSHLRSLTFICRLLLLPLLSRCLVGPVEVVPQVVVVSGCISPMGLAETTTRLGIWILFIMLLIVRKFCRTTRPRMKTFKLVPMSIPSA